MRVRAPTSQRVLKKQIPVVKNSIQAANDTIYKAYAKVQEINPYLPIDIEDIDKGHLSTLKLKGATEDSKQAVATVMKLEAITNSYKSVLKKRQALYKEVKEHKIKRDDLTKYRHVGSGQSVKLNKLDQADMDYQHMRQTQYETLIDVMRSLLQVTGQMEAFYMALGFENDENLANVYAALEETDPSGLTRTELLTGIQTHFAKIESGLLKQLDELNASYVALRKEVDPHYKATLEKTESIKNDLQQMSSNLSRITEILAEDKSHLAPIVKEIQDSLKDILLLNSLDQSDFNDVVNKYVELLKKLEGKIKEGLDDKSDAGQEALGLLKNTQMILGGKFKDKMNDFRISFMGDVAATSIELLLPITFSALNALVPIPMPQLGSLESSLSSAFYSAGKLGVGTVASSATSPAHQSLEKLNAEWQQIWYLEALKKANVPKQVMKSVAMVGLGLTLTAIGLPHLAVVLVPAGLSASSVVIPKALEKVEKYSKNKSVKTFALTKFKELDTKLSQSSSALIAKLMSITPAPIKEKPIEEKIPEEPVVASTHSSLPAIAIAIAIASQATIKKLS